MIDEKMVEYALSEVINHGRTAYDVGRELNVNVDVLSNRLRMIPAYREHRKQFKTNDDLDCPQCATGKLIKRELYFWQCGCGAEFWPDEESIPEDCDKWMAIPLAMQSGQGEAVAMIRRLWGEGKGKTEICAALNDAGILTPRGKPWARINLLAYMRRNGIENASRAEAIKIIESMAGRTGISCKTIAERLNAEGYKTSRNEAWTMNGVRKVIRETLKMDVPLKRANALALNRKELYPEKLANRHDHPWSKAEHARIQESIEKVKIREGEKR